MMVVLAPGHEIRASDIPGDILEGAPPLLPCWPGRGGAGRRAGAQRDMSWNSSFGGLMDLRLQVEELRRRLDDHGGKVQVTDGPGGGQLTPDRHRAGRASVPSRCRLSAWHDYGDVERATIVAALRECQGNRRQAAAKLGIGERTLYRKIKEFNLA